MTMILQFVVSIWSTHFSKISSYLENFAHVLKMLNWLEHVISYVYQNIKVHVPSDIKRLYEVKKIYYEKAARLIA